MITEIRNVQVSSSPGPEAMDKMRESFRTIADFSIDFIYWLGPDGQMEYLSPAGARLTGYTLKDFRSSPALLWNMAIPLEREQWLSHHHDTWPDGTLRPLEFHLLTKNGQTKLFSHTCHPLYDAAGTYLGIYSSNRDLTDQKKNEQQLTVFAQELEWQNWRLGVAYEELERINKELDDFAYISSHDLREPLRGIRNYASFLLTDYQDRLDEDGRAKLHTLVSLSDRLDKLIESLLHYSRVGRQDLLLQETDLNIVLADVLESIKVTLEETRVEVKVPSPLPNVVCDPVRVREVFYNLITNAIKYNDKNEKLVEISYFHQRPDEELNQWTEFEPGSLQPVFYISDNGIGIREKHLETVFRIFKRLHARDKYGGGTGVGLTIVKKIVERHGGTIWVESKVGEGTTFYFTLAKELEKK